MNSMEKDIDYVIAVAECGSISKAAELLYISQPSLSRYLSNLENELGMALFVRTINGTELTEAGNIYVEYAKEIRRLRSTMNAKLRELKRSEAKRIRVGMTLNSISLSAFNISERVREKYPSCTAEIFNLMSKDIPQALKEEKYDFAIGPDLDWPPELNYEEFAADPFILVAPERYDLDALACLREGVEFPLVDLRALPDLDWILQDETTAVRKGINKICRKLNYQIRPKLEVTSSTIALQAAESQMGCCVVALGHLAYLNHREHLRFYQISAEDYSSVGVVSLRGKFFQEEERYCISCIKKAWKAGDRQLSARIRGV